MKRYYKETGRKSPTTSIKNTKNRFEKTDKELYDKLIGNIDALEKLWGGIGLQKYSLYLELYKSEYSEQVKGYKWAVKVV